MSFEAWRCWRIRDWQTGMLGAAHLDYLWEGPTIGVPAEEVGALHQGCGYHAFKSEADARAYMMGYVAPVYNPYVIWTNPPPAGEQNWAFGKVSLYGVVAEHERGYRASHAIVRHLYVSPVWSEEFKARLADRYQCPVEVWPERRQEESGVSGWAASKAAYDAQRKAYDAMHTDPPKRRITLGERIENFFFWEIPDSVLVGGIVGLITVILWAGLHG
jgi:hypothetical protein